MSPSRNQIEKLADKKAIDIPLRIKLCGPLADLSILQRSLFFSETAMIGYLCSEECKIAASKLGFANCQYFEGDGSQAFLFSNEFDSVVVCKGIETLAWSEIAAEVDARIVLAETIGKVHRGFKREADVLWPALETALADNNKPLWFAGHSIGAAVTNICATRCLLSQIKSEPEQLFTFGSPRVGNDKYVNQVNLTHYRWVLNRDIVPHVPPFWFGFRHSGHEMYINRLGQLKTAQDRKDFGDHVQACLNGIVRIRPGQLTNHPIREYVEAIHSIQRRLEPDARPPAAGTNPAISSRTLPATHKQANSNRSDIETPIKPNGWPTDATFTA